MKSHLFRPLFGGALLVLVLLVALLPAPSPGQAPAGSGSTSSFDAIVPDLEPSRERYVAEPGEDAALESERLLAMGDYFYHRVSYPTGQFDPARSPTTAPRANPPWRLIPTASHPSGLRRCRAPAASTATAMDWSAAAPT